MPPFATGVVLYTFGCSSINDAQNPATLVRLRDDYFHGVGGSAMDVTDFRYIADSSQNVDREAVAHHDVERVAGADSLCIFSGGGPQFLIISFSPDQAGAGSLIEGNPELHLGDGIHDCLVNVLHRLNEVTGPHNDVRSFWNR